MGPGKLTALGSPTAPNGSTAGVGHPSGSTVSGRPPSPDAGSDSAAMAIAPLLALASWRLRRSIAG